MTLIVIFVPLLFLFVFGGLQVNKEYWAGVCIGFLLGAGVGLWVFIWSLTS